MASSKKAAPSGAIVARVPYVPKGKLRNELVDALSCHGYEGDSLTYARHLLERFPTVYLAVLPSRGKRGTQVYVGESNDVATRNSQHLQIAHMSRVDGMDSASGLNGDEDTVIMGDEVMPRATSFWRGIIANPANSVEYIIGHEHFNKSLTLDVENQLISFLLAIDGIDTVNKRSNAQGDYYPREEFEAIFTDIWRQLSEDDPDLFPVEEVIRDRAIFKASPFHRLSEDQRAAEQRIVDAVIDVLEHESEAPIAKGEFGKLVFVQGMAGTGKTVLLSHLFYSLLRGLELGASGELPYGLRVPRAHLVVNQDAQQQVYSDIISRLSLGESGDLVHKAVQFINLYSEQQEGRSPQASQAFPVAERADVVLIDEAHLLLTQGAQSYSGKSQLLDILRRAKLVIAVFDPAQVMRNSQRVPEDMLYSLQASHEQAPYEDNGSSLLFINRPMFGENVDMAVIELTEQFRMNAGPATLKWIDNLLLPDGGFVGAIPLEDPPEGREPYDVRVFDSPLAMFDAIEALNAEGAADERQRYKDGLSRVLATYDWRYKRNPAEGYVQLYFDSATGQWLMEKPEGAEWTFSKPWNYVRSAELKRASSSSKKRRSKESGVWVEREGLDEIGSLFTIQGFDLNYAAVILGPSIRYVDGEVRIVADTAQKVGGAYRDESVIRNEIGVLLRRGIRGLFLFAVDPALQAKLMEAYEDFLVRKQDMNRVADGADVVDS